MARWVHIVAVFAVAALMANAQCYALCLASICQTTDNCHHSGKAGCHYRQSNSAGVEAGSDLARIPVVSLAAIAVDLAACGLFVGFGQESLRPLERGSPPGKTSVLRI